MRYDDYILPTIPFYARQVSFGCEALAPTDETERFSLRGSVREAREPIRVATQLTAIRNCSRFAPGNYLINSSKGKEAPASSLCVFRHLRGSANRHPRLADGADYDYITDESYSYDDNGNRTMTGYETGANNETLADGTYRYSYDMMKETEPKNTSGQIRMKMV